MTTIKEQSRQFTAVEQYLMTSAPSITSIKDVQDGTSIDVDGYVIFDDVKETGEVSEIMSIITPEKQVYSCQSKTFKSSLKDIENIMAGEKYAIIKISGTTKAGRPYVNCVLDISKM